MKTNLRFELLTTDYLRSSFMKNNPSPFTLLLDQSVKCGHTSKQTNNLFLLDSSLREREYALPYILWRVNKKFLRIDGIRLNNGGNNSRNDCRFRLCVDDHCKRSSEILAFSIVFIPFTGRYIRTGFDNTLISQIWGIQSYTF